MVKKKIKRISKRIVESQANPEFFLIVGVFMVFGTLMKLMGIVYFSSDWFWFIAGLSLVSEGFILVAKKQRYNHKHVKKYIEIKN